MSAEMTDSTDATSELEALIEAGDGEAIANFLHLLPPEDTAYTVSHLPDELRNRMFEELSNSAPELGADLLEHFVDEYAATVIEQLEPERAAALVDEMDSDEQTDVLSELDEQDAEAILERMDPEEARDTRQRMGYDEDVAGGLMITEYLFYNQGQTVGEVTRDLHEKAEEHLEFEVRYIYVVDDDGKLTGVVPMRSLVFVPGSRTIASLQIREPVTVSAQAHLDDLHDLFDRVDYSAVPVVDGGGVLLGVVQRAAVQEAIGDRESDQFLKFGGIIGGEELRSMPLLSRVMRRLAFLLPSVVLSSMAVTVILLFEPVIAKITLLAVFLPLVANLSGAAGNQAVAVSIRELALGLVLPGDWRRVGVKEMRVGLINGLVIGLLLGGIAIAFAWFSHQTGEGTQRVPNMLLLGLVVMLAYTFNSVLSVFIGGTIPLLLKAIKLDPAMASSPLLTTLSDMGSFLLTLVLAYFLILGPIGG